MKTPLIRFLSLFLFLIPLMFSCQQVLKQEEVCFDADYTEVQVLHDNRIVRTIYGKGPCKVDTLAAVGPLSDTTIVRIREILAKRNIPTITCYRFEEQSGESIEILVAIKTCEVWTAHTGMFRKD